MTTPVTIRDEDLENAAFRELYMRYLGTLRVLGELASRADMAEVCMGDECNAVLRDAQAYLKPRVTVKAYEGTAGWALEPT